MPIKYHPITPKSSAPDWQGETWRKRLEHCTLALFLHGFLTPQETETVKARLAEWCERARKKERAIPGTKKRKAPHVESVQQAHERISKLTRKRMTPTLAAAERAETVEVITLSETGRNTTRPTRPRARGSDETGARFLFPVPAMPPPLEHEGKRVEPRYTPRVP